MKFKANKWYLFGKTFDENEREKFRFIHLNEKEALCFPGVIRNTRVVERVKEYVAKLSGPGVESYGIFKTDEDGQIEIFDLVQTSEEKIKSVNKISPYFNLINAQLQKVVDFNHSNYFKN